MPCLTCMHYRSNCERQGENLKPDFGHCSKWNREFWEQYECEKYSIGDELPPVDERSDAESKESEVLPYGEYLDRRIDIITGEDKVKRNFFGSLGLCIFITLIIEASFQFSLIPFIPYGVAYLLFYFFDQKTYKDGKRKLPRSAGWLYFTVFMSFFTSVVIIGNYSGNMLGTPEDYPQTYAAFIVFYMFVSSLIFLFKKKK